MTIEEIEADIIAKLPVAMAIAQEDVYTVMDNTLKTFYASYSPRQYERTYQLMNSCVKGAVVSSGFSASADTYYDSGTMTYSTGLCPSGDAVMSAANAGLHGAMGLKTVGGGVPVYPYANSAVGHMAKAIVGSALAKAGIPIS